MNGTSIVKYLKENGYITGQIKMKSIKENKLIYKNNIDNNYKKYYIKYLENKYIIKDFLYLIFIFFNKKIKKFIPFFQKLFFVTIF